MFIPKMLQAVMKYDTFDPNLALGFNSTSMWTFGTNWYLKGDDLKLQVDYLFTDIGGLVAKNRKLMMRLQTLF